MGNFSNQQKAKEEAKERVFLQPFATRFRRSCHRVDNAIILFIYRYSKLGCIDRRNRIHNDICINRKYNTQIAKEAYHGHVSSYLYYWKCYRSGHSCLALYQTWQEMAFKSLIKNL